MRNLTIRLLTTDHRKLTAIFLPPLLNLPSKAEMLC